MQHVYAYQTAHPQFLPWFQPPYMPHATASYQPFASPRFTSSFYQPPTSHPANETANRRPPSDYALMSVLDDRINTLKQLHDRDQQQELPVVIDLLDALRRLPRATLIPAVKNETLALVRPMFTAVLQQWPRLPFLPANEASLLRLGAKVIHRVIKAVDDVKQVPLWLADSSLLDALASCLNAIATRHGNNHELRSFAHLLDAYTLFQKTHLNRDAFTQLLQSVHHCLASNHFVRAFDKLATSSPTLSTADKFFLLKCPAFLVSYSGSNLEETMHTLLSTMLSQYESALGRVLASPSSAWSSATKQCVASLLSMIAHGTELFASSRQVVGEHVALVDHALACLETETETEVVSSALQLLVTLLGEAKSVSHLKERGAASTFLRWASSENEELVLKAYTLLAFTTNEEDIQKMRGSDRLLSTIIQSLEAAVVDKSGKASQVEQLLETLKGLVQHDQIKGEIVKQNVLPFLVDLSNTLSGKAHVSILEILWSMTFNDAGAQALSSNAAFLESIQSVSTSSHNEALKKAADGLVWKLIREPAFLEKIAKQEEEAEYSDSQAVTETIVEEVVDSTGQKQLVTTIKPATNTSGERIFQYDMMISYCHADKELTYKIHRFLVQQGFKVWIDLDNMHGPAMSAMADAVENSEFVILCMSDAYKQSAYCQAEAEYAFNCKRRLIPLIMRPKYRPDGWLGFLIGSRIYVDFGRFEFGVACEKLMTEISLQSKRPLPEKSKALSQHEAPDKTASDKKRGSDRKPSTISTKGDTASALVSRNVRFDFNRKFVKQWTDADVQDFLSAARLTQMMPLCAELNGYALIRLYEMCASRNSRMYSLLSDELKSMHKLKLPIAVFTRFLIAMEQRMNMIPDAWSQPPISYYETNVTTVAPEYLPVDTRTMPVVSYNAPSYQTSPASKPYDLLITSNAPAMDVLRTVERYGPGFAKAVFARTERTVLS